jgi:formiminotetrahydrofolate cyclodeaminase
VQAPERSFTQDTVGDLIAEVGSARLAPGAGSVAALSAALAAAITESVALLSREAAGDAEGAAQDAADLRERLVLIADANAGAYREATRSLAREHPDEPLRDERLGSDLARAAYTPLSIAEVAAQVADFAAVLAKGAAPEVRADAVVAACIAEGAARGAAHLVRINLGMAPEDERIQRAAEFAEAAAASRERALGGAPG